MLPLSSFLKKISENIALKLVWVSTVSEFEAVLQIIMNKIQETNKDWQKMGSNTKNENPREIAPAVTLISLTVITAKGIESAMCWESRTSGTEVINTEYNESHYYIF